MNIRPHLVSIICVLSLVANIYAFIKINELRNSVITVAPYNCTLPSGQVDTACMNRFHAQNIKDPIQAKQVLCLIPEVKSAFAEAGSPCN